MKKLISAFLALAICLSLSVPAFSAENNESEYDEIVVFSDAMTQNGIQPMSDLTNEERIQLAKDGVQSLNLDEIGFDYIAEACLSELNGFLEEDDITLYEYTVLIPKNRAATPTYYGTYKDVDIYTAIVSKSEYGHEYGTDYKATLDSWVSGAIDLLMLLDGTGIASTSWSIFSASTNIPSTYSVLKNDKLVRTAIFNPQTRALYVKDGDSYRNVLNREFGRARCVAQYTSLNVDIGARSYNYPIQNISDITASNRENFLIIAWGAYVNNYNAPLEFYMWFDIKLDWESDE